MEKIHEIYYAISHVNGRWKKLLWGYPISHIPLDEISLREDHPLVALKGETIPAIVVMANTLMLGSKEYYKTVDLIVSKMNEIGPGCSLERANEIASLINLGGIDL